VFQTDLVYPQEKGEIQITTAFGFHRASKRSIARIPFVVEYGITDKWQVEAEWDAFTRLKRDGLPVERGQGDLSIATKYSFMKIAGSDFHAAVGFELVAPLGDAERGMGEGVIEYEPFFILAKDFPKLKNLQVFTQIGVGLVQRGRSEGDDDDEPAAHELNWNTGFFVPVHALVLTTEFNWSSNKWNNGGQDKEMYFTPGVVWKLPGTWEVGVGAPIGLNSGADKFRAIFKLTYEIGGRESGENISTSK